MGPSEQASRSRDSHDAEDLYTSDSEDSRRSNSRNHDYSPLSRMVRERQAEYTRRRTIRIKVGTWNVAAIPGTERDVGKWFVQEQGLCKQLAGTKFTEDVARLKKVAAQFGERRSPETAGPTDNTRMDGATDPEADGPPDEGEVGLYVLGLQEIVDVSSPAEALRPYVDPAPSKRWKDAMQSVLPEGYQLVSEVQLVGLLLLIYAAPSIAPLVSSVSSASVGTGLLGYMGNKGAVSTRILLGETTSLIFVNCHLAAGSDKSSLDRRNWDAEQIISRSKFERVNPDQTLRDDPCHTIGKEDYGFWFGDLNYRLDDIPGDDVRNILARHTVNEYDKTIKPVSVGKDTDSDSASTVVRREPRSSSSSSSSEEDEVDSYPSPVTDEDIEPHADPASLQTTISSLLPHDQLRVQQQQNKAFHEGWREGEISFLPTYKYDVGSVALFDTSEKHRGPSWCDRILFRTHRDQLEYERRVREAAEAKKKDEEMKARGLDKAAADDNVLFDYDPATDGADSVSDHDISEDDASEHRLPDDSESAAIDDPLRLEYYTSHQGILSSDHKPIDAGFRLTFDCVIPELKAKVHQDVVRELDKAENEARPDLTVVVDTPGDGQRQPMETEAPKDPNAVDFGDIAFDVPVVRILTIANTSGVPATFLFADKPSFEAQRDAVTAPWLKIRVDRPVVEDTRQEKQRLPCEKHTLLPGEVSNVEITAHVKDIHHVRMLNSGSLQLEEILVLRVKKGRDHFIPVYAKWLPTCFGRSIEELTRIPETGARSLATGRAKSDDQDSSVVRLSAPRELYRLTESIAELTERAVAEWSMTTSTAEQEETTPPWATTPDGIYWPFKPETWTLKDMDQRSHLLALVREALDTNQSLTGVFPHDVPSLHRLEIISETLMAFLRSLSDGVVTANVWHEMEQQIIAREKAKTKQPPRSWEESQAWVLDQLSGSPAHSVSFTFVTFMLVRIVNEVSPSPTVPSPATPAAATPADQSSSSSPTITTSPASTAAFISGGSFRRRPSTTTTTTPSGGGAGAGSVSEISTSPVLVRRRAVETALASIFADLLISTEVTGPSPKGKERKDRRAWEERKRSIVEPFLKSVGVDGEGPSGGGGG